MPELEHQWYTEPDMRRRRRDECSTEQLQQYLLRQDYYDLPLTEPGTFAQALLKHSFSVLGRRVRYTREEMQIITNQANAQLDHAESIEGAKDAKANRKNHISGIAGEVVLQRTLRAFFQKRATNKRNGEQPMEIVESAVPAERDYKPLGNDVGLIFPEHYRNNTIVSQRGGPSLEADAVAANDSHMLVFDATMSMGTLLDKVETDGERGVQLVQMMLDRSWEDKPNAAHWFHVLFEIEKDYRVGHRFNSSRMSTITLPIRQEVSQLRDILTKWALQHKRTDDPEVIQQCFQSKNRRRRKSQSTTQVATAYGDENGNGNGKDKRHRKRPSRKGNKGGRRGKGGLQY